MPARVTAKNVGGVFLRHSVYYLLAFSALTLLVEWQEEHPVKLSNKVLA